MVKKFQDGGKKKAPAKSTEKVKTAADFRKEREAEKAYARATIKSSPNSHSNARATKVVGGNRK